MRQKYGDSTRVSTMKIADIIGKLADPTRPSIQGLENLEQEPTDDILSTGQTVHVCF
ncbi:hypothetical protein CASFOL_042413 [Castilleja foliolosa]|uniref:Uncharacterized protein n=1 Tax=Castilleja foliolosa TaxID=1961234 RepID=A0ABD3BAP9_9LAMI